MLKLLYKPVAIVAGIVGGLLSGLIFKWVWKVVGRGSRRLRRWTRSVAGGRSCWPQACMARYTRWSRRLSTAAPPSGRTRKPESGRAVHSSTLTSRLTTARLKPPPIGPGDRGAPRSRSATARQWPYPFGLNRVVRPVPCWRSSTERPQRDIRFGRDVLDGDVLQFPLDRQPQGGRALLADRELLAFP